MRTASSHLSLAFLAVLVGFLLILSKVPWLQVLGIVLTFGGLLAPFYRDPLVRAFHRISGKPKQLEPTSLISKEDFSGRDASIGSEESKAITKSSAPSQNTFSENKSLVVGPADALRAYLDGGDLRELHLFGADLRGLTLPGANLSKMNLSRVNFSRMNLSKADLSEADLSEADLSWTDLSGANLSWAYCKGANFSGANLSGAMLLSTDLTGVDLTGCSVYGISASDAQLESAIQTNLIITPPSEPIITVDNLKVAQFVSLLLNSKEICDVVNTVGTKVVLVLGLFTPNREVILNVLKDKLRRKGYLPVVFDLDKPSSRDLTEEISALAHMSRFIIADVVNPESFSSKLRYIVPSLSSIPIQPLVKSSINEYNAFKSFETYPWFLKVFHYKDVADLLSSIEERVIEPPEEYYRHAHDNDTVIA